MYVGLDGCRYGWVCCQIQDKKISFVLLKHISDITKLNSSIMFIDIPIGLGDKKVKRTIDVELRKLLSKNRKSSVFTPPIMEVLEVENYKIGNEISKKISGKGISIQSWNISKKIKEVNDFLLTKNSYQCNLFESHPELCFESINKKPLIYSKKTDNGIMERLEILNQHISLNHKKVTDFYGKFKSNMLKKDDIIDAAVLALSAKLWSKNGKCQITQEIPHDSNGIPFKIRY